VRLDNSEIENISSSLDLSPMKDSTILLTGATGMLGSMLLEMILKVSKLQDNSPREIKVLSLKGDFSTIADLKQFKVLNFEKFDQDKENYKYNYDYVIHAASPASPAFFLPIEQMTRINSGMIEAMVSKSTSKFLYVSAGEVYGIKSSIPMKESNVTNPIYDDSRNSYPLSKIYAEEKCLELQSKLSVDFKIARLFHTFGPGVRENDGRSFADFIWRASKGKKPILKSTGEDVRTFLYTADAAVGIIKQLISESKVTTVNIGSEIPYTILEFAQKVSSAAGLGGEVEFEEINEVKAEKKIIIPDNEKLKELNWQQTYDLDDAIKRTLDWVRGSK
jgi:nucleoside-diphosphate-sugar epimerase